VSEVDFSGEHEERSEEEEEENGTREVRVVHYVLVYSSEWVENS
jgi:hypothetical protein